MTEPMFLTMMSGHARGSHWSRCRVLGARIDGESVYTQVNRATRKTECWAKTEACPNRDRVDASISHRDFEITTMQEREGTTG